jgi:hypothetical protein
MSNVTLTVVGDIAFGGPFAADPVGVAKRVAPSIRDLLRADIVLGNLEGPLCNIPAETANPLSLSSPIQAIESIRWLGINAVALANNHIMDCGRAGLESTLTVLQENGVAHFGAGLDKKGASQPAIINVAGTRVAFLGFHGGKIATRNGPGTLIVDSSWAKKIIRRTRRQCDHLVVYFHGGIEAVNHPLRTVMQACRRCVDCGATLVVGTHTHTIQGIETYHGVPIAYSLGNFILPMALPDRYEQWRKATGLTRLGIPFDRRTILRALVLKCTLHKEGKAEAKGVPIIVDESGLPRLPTMEEAAEAETFFLNLCESFHHPDAPCWRQRDEIEKGFFRLQRSEFTLGYIARNLMRARPRHLVAYIKTILRS